MGNPGWEEAMGLRALLRLKPPYRDRSALATARHELVREPAPKPLKKRSSCYCPICAGTEFIDFNGRIAVRCARCHSMERTRLLFAVLERSGSLRNGLDVLHFAPESGLGRRLKNLSRRYVPADLDIGQYAKLFPEAECIDLCADDLARFRGQFDLVIHSHVLEHLPCSIAAVLRNMTACLRPGGKMFFAVPIRQGAPTTEEGPSENLSPEERKRRYGQHDHVRMIGDTNAMDIFHDALGKSVRPFPVSEFFSSEEIEKMALTHEVDRLSGDTIFVVQA